MRRLGSIKQPIIGVAASIACSFASQAANADTYSVSISNPMDLGTVTAAPSGTTTFQINPSSGQVSLQSGDGRRISTALVRVLVTISCQANGNGNGNGNGKDCKNNKIGVMIGGVGITTGRALPLTNYTVSTTSASLSGGVSGSNPISFTINPVNPGQTASFYLGANFPVAGDDTGNATGLGLSPFYVIIKDPSGNQLDSLLSSGLLTAYRALGISKTSDLQFGIVSQAKTSGTVTLDPNTGVRTVSGGGIGFASPTPTLAAFTITGEGGQAFSVSVPSVVQLTGGTNLNVTTATNLPSTPVLSSSAGNAGTFALKVGGSFPISNGSITGAYSGSFTVTVNYN